MAGSTTGLTDPGKTIKQDNKIAWLYKWAPLGVVLLTAIVFARAAFSKFSVFDDDFFILNNKLVKDLSADGLLAIFSDIKSGKYQPLTTLSFAIEYKLFGFDPLPFHITNIVLHLLSTWLVFKIAERLSGNRITAIVVSLLFGIHPMHVEEVAWAAERKDMLYAFFYLWALLVYLRYIDSGGRVKYIVGVFVLFAAALLSKSEAITLPLVLILFDWFKSRKMSAGAYLEKIPFVVCSVIILWMSLRSQQTDGGIGQVSLVSYGFVNRIFLFTTVPAFYIIKLIAPLQLSAMHYYPDLHHGLMPWMYYASLPFIIIVVMLIVKAPSYVKEQEYFLKRQVIFGFLFFAGTICVMPQLVSVGPSLTPERYTYIPYVGLFFIIGQWVSVVSLVRWKTATVAVLGAFVLFFSMLSFMRIGVWKDSETLMTDMIEKNSDVTDCSFLYWLRGNARMQDENYPDAIQDYNVATQQHRGYVEAYNNKGTAHFQMGDIKAAISDYDSSIKYAPGHARSYYNRGSGKATIGDFPGALADYDQFLKLTPDDKQAYMDRGMVRFTLKDTSGACSDWQKAVSLGNDKALPFVQQICR